MPLVRQARLTSKKIHANRRNGRKSHGPKPRVKQPSNMGGAPAAPVEALAGASGPPDSSLIERAREAVLPESLRSALEDLQEDPLQFARHHQELIAEWQPITPTQRKLVLRLAYLMWRQQRAERAQDGVAACRIEKEVAARAQRGLDGTAAPRQAFLGKVPDEGGLRQLPPSYAKFEQLLEYFQFLIDHLNAGDFSDDWEVVLKQIYGSKPTWRCKAITEWARQLAEYRAYEGSQEAEEGSEEHEKGGEEGEKDEESEEGQEGEEGQEDEKHEVGWEPPHELIGSEARKKKVRRLLRCVLAQEQRDVTLEYRLYSALNLDFPSHLRNALCAPQDKYAGTAIRQEQALAQDIERVLRLIMKLKAREGSPDAASGRAASRRRARRGGGPQRWASGGRK